MINIDFSFAIAVYILATLVIILLLWLFDKKQKGKDLTLPSRFIWFCWVCAYSYINTKENIISTCPRCGSYNRK